MKRLRLLIILLLVFIFAGSYLVQAQELPTVPPEIIISGSLRLPDNNAPYPKGTYYLDIGLYSDEACGVTDLVYDFGTSEVVIDAHKVKDDDGTRKFDAGFDIKLNTSSLPPDLTDPLFIKYYETVLGGSEVIQVSSVIFSITSQQTVTVYDEDNKVFKSSTKVKPDKAKCAELVKDDQTPEECLPAREVYVDEAKNAHTVDGLHASSNISDTDMLVVYGAIAAEQNDWRTSHDNQYADDWAAHDTEYAAHISDQSAHHAKTTLFSELTDTATDSQIPDSITIDKAKDSDKLDGYDSSYFAEKNHTHSFPSALKIASNHSNPGGPEGDIVLAAGATATISVPGIDVKWVVLGGGWNHHDWLGRHGIRVTGVGNEYFTIHNGDIHGENVMSWLAIGY